MSSGLVRLAAETDRLRQKSWAPRFVSCVVALALPDVSVGTCPRYSLVVDEDVKKPK